MKSEQERRRHKRFIYEAQIAYTIASSDTIRSGKMFNFSKGGIYFESEQSLPPGQDIVLDLATNAESDDDDICFLFDVKIIWRKSLQDSSLPYGYGGKFLNPVDSKIEDDGILHTGVSTFPFEELEPESETRQHPRRPYNKPLKFRHNHVEYTGFVANIGRGGAFIATGEQFAIGAKITLMVPGIHTRKEVKISGRIVRRTPDGIGLRFERRSGRERRGDADRRIGQDRRGWERRKD